MNCVKCKYYKMCEFWYDPIWDNREKMTLTKKHESTFKLLDLDYGCNEYSEDNEKDLNDAIIGIHEELTKLDYDLIYNIGSTYKIDALLNDIYRAIRKKQSYLLSLERVLVDQNIKIK